MQSKNNKFQWSVKIMAWTSSIALSWSCADAAANEPLSKKATFKRILKLDDNITAIMGRCLTKPWILAAQSIKVLKNNEARLLPGSAPLDLVRLRSVRIERRVDTNVSSSIGNRCQNEVWSSGYYFGKGQFMIWAAFGLAWCTEPKPAIQPRCILKNTWS